MRSKAFKGAVLWISLAALTLDGAAAQVAPPRGAPVPSVPAPTPTPTIAPTSPVAPTPTVTRRQNRNGGGADVTAGGGGISSGGGSGLGIGLGVAGAALAVGFIGAMGRPSTFSGENSEQIVTGPGQTDQSADPPRRRRQIRTRTQTGQPRQQTPRVIRSGFVVPSANETRFVPDEVLLVVKEGITPQRLKRIETTYGLTPLASARIGLLKADVRRYRLKPGASLRTTIAALRGNASVTSAQPNYRFELQIDPAPPATKATLSPGDGKIAPSPIPTSGPVQYAVEILHLTTAHHLATGADVRVAIIDSGVDETNPDLKGAVVERFDAVGTPFKPHAHGTAIGGTIVAHHTLVGVAPQAKLIAIRAFSGAAVGADGTGFDILRGLDFAATHGARVVNMSFAGPQDLLLANALREALKRGIVAVAAAGNGGPQAQPLYPGADPGIIAVTATDAGGKPFARANRGPYIAVAAPGVNIIAPGLGDSVQITSGTSIATAEASGVVALLLQRTPKATPDQIRRLLSETARPLSIEQSAGGAGVIDADAALAATK